MQKHLLLTLIIACLFVSCKNNKNTNDGDSSVDSTAVLITQIQKTSKLYTVEYKLHKIITHNDSKQLQGNIMNRDFNITLPMSQRLVAIPMDATVKAYVDFSEFSSENISRKGNKIEIVLPDPHIAITSTRINHKDVKQYVSFARSNFTDAELLSYEKQGRQQIVQAIPQLGIVEQARESSARVLIPLIKQLGYNEADITITFRKQFSAQDYSTLIDKNIEQ